MQRDGYEARERLKTLIQVPMFVNINGYWQTTGQDNNACQNVVH